MEETDSDTSNTIAQALTKINPEPIDFDEIRLYQVESFDFLSFDFHLKRKQQTS